MSRELVFMIVKIQSIFWIFHIMIVLTASRDSWCPIFFLSRLPRKLVYAFKIIPFSNFALKSKRQRRFSVWPVDGRFCSPFASTDPSISSSSSALPRTSERMEQGEIRRQISNRGTPAHAEKVFHYFQKGLSRFQSRHTWSLFHFFTILYNFSLFFFSLKLHWNREWNHMLVFLCVSLFEQTSTGAASSVSVLESFWSDRRKMEGVLRHCCKTTLFVNLTESRWRSTPP